LIVQTEPRAAFGGNLSGAAVGADTGATDAGADASARAPYHLAEVVVSSRRG
jgi:hypothetical protein